MDWCCMDGCTMGNDGSRVGNDGSMVSNDGSRMGNDGSRVGNDGSGMGHNWDWMSNWSWMCNTFVFDISNISPVADSISMVVHNLNASIRQVNLVGSSHSCSIGCFLLAKVGAR